MSIFLRYTTKEFTVKLDVPCDDEDPFPVLIGIEKAFGMKPMPVIPTAPDLLRDPGRRRQKSRRV